MAITQAITTSFKVELLKGFHDFRASGGDSFYLALVTSSSTISGSTANLAAIDGQVAGTGGYTTGGHVLVSVDPVLSGSTAVCDFADVTWSASTITARGGLLYNSTPASGTNTSVCVLDFGADKTSASGDFTVMFPAADASNAIIRIA